MKGVKLWMILIILLCQTSGAYCFFQEDAADLEPAVQEMLAQREALEKKYIVYQQQKALEKEKIKERLSLTKIKLEQIQDAQSRKNINIQTNINIASKNENLKKTTGVKSLKIMQTMLLLAGLCGCVYWIYRINKKNLNQ